MHIFHKNFGMCYVMFKGTGTGFEGKVNFVFIKKKLLIIYLVIFC